MYLSEALMTNVNTYWVNTCVYYVINNLPIYDVDY